MHIFLTFLQNEISKGDVACYLSIFLMYSFVVNPLYVNIICYPVKLTEKQAKPRDNKPNTTYITMHAICFPLLPFEISLELSTTPTMHTIKL